EERVNDLNKERVVNIIKESSDNYNKANEKNDYNEANKIAENNNKTRADKPES
ncbi:34235_t:CDS:2, partial [Racocetra persica]